jgi:G3E family GTPase
MNHLSLPISVITGFLGSGKTTLLARLLTHPGMCRALVVVNDFGEVGLDHLLIARPVDEVISLDSGCLCCTLQGDLVETLKSIVVRWTVAPDFDRVFIETTGLADPTGILHTLLTGSDVAPHYSVDAVITVVDSVNGVEVLRSQPASTRQILAADHLVISKTDLAAKSELMVLMQHLRDLNPTAEQHICVRGQIDPSVLLAPAARRIGSALMALGSDQNSVQAHSGTLNSDRAQPQQHHFAHGNIQTFTLRLQRPVTREGLALWIHLVSAHLGPALLRIKGMVNVAGNPVVIHAVRYLFYDPIPLPEWPNKDHDTRIVFITQGIDRHALERTFSAFDLPPGQKPGLDPTRYERLAGILQNFRKAGRLAK